MVNIQKKIRSAASAQHIKTANKKAILDTLKEHGPISRTELASRLVLSKATVSSLVGELLHENLVLETGSIQSSGVGRNAIELTFNAAYGNVLAVDIGRFWIRLAVSDLNGDVLETQIRETSGSKSLETLIGHIESGMHELIAKLGLKLPQILSVCVSAPGVIDREGFLKGTLAIPQLNGVNLGSLLSKILPASTSIWIENDIRVAAVAENWKGIGAKYKTFVLLGIGSGLGCGFIFNGQLFRGAFNAAGEIGFLKMSIDDNRPIEYDLSSDGIVQAANRLLAGGEAKFADVKSVFRHVAEDPDRHRVFIDWFVQRLIYLIDVIHCVINPEAVVLGGGIGRHLSFLMPVLRGKLGEMADPPQIELSGFGDNVQLIGATNMALNHVMEEILEFAEQQMNPDLSGAGVQGSNR